MKKSISLLLLSLLMIAPSCQKPKEITNEYNIVPQPNQLVPKEGRFELNKQVRLVTPSDAPEVKKVADGFAEQLKQTAGISLTEAESADGKPAISFVVQEDMPKEAYRLSVTPTLITVTASQPNGFFYGVQTIYQLLPPAVYGKKLNKKADWSVPAVEIEDAPRFVHRGLMLDVCRHYAPIEYIYKFIDLLAMNKMNVFHWHLTDDQGWRIEIKKYPKLTEIGSQRSRTVIGKNTQEYDNTPYGGFYTQEEAKEIVKYAQERYITVIPEVDLPGHMLAALAAYPELGCTGGPYEVCPRWGVFEDVLCIGNDKTMQFLEDVMGEIIEIFPSEYVHIGGDEAPRDRWKECPKCQARIKAEGLKADKNHTAEDRLQSYCMTRIEKFLNSKGRRIIGWDEILEGDVAPNATVMSWRGMEGGIEAAQLGHDVIMTPTSFCYFDYYQTADTQDEPLGIGGYVPIEKVYSLEPVPTTLTKEQGKHILGAQANLWTEYIASTEHVEYMILPRMAALAEVQWTQPEKKDFKDFTTRLARLMKFYQRDGFNYAKHVFDLKADFTPDTDKKAVVVTLSTIDDAPIYYTLDGTEPTTASLKYTEPIAITETADFQAVVIRPEGKSKVVSKKISFNKATYCPIELTFQPSEKYKFGGAVTLVDGMKGNDSYATGAWLGFVGGDVEAIIDLGQETEIKRVATSAVVDMSAWIMGSTGLVVSVSDDNKEFREVASKDIPAETNIDKKGVENYEITFDPVKARYVKVVIKRSPALPKGHAGEGKAAYMFIDEIEVD